MSTPRILIIGANGQIGTDLASVLAERHGREARSEEHTSELQSH